MPRLKIENTPSMVLVLTGKRLAKVNRASRVFLAAMIDGLVAGELLTDLAELLVFVGHQVRAGIKVIAKRFLHVEEILAGDVGGLHFAVALDQGEYGVLFALAGIATLASSGAATDEGFVGFNDPAISAELADLDVHGETDAMTQMPRALNGYAEGAR